MPSACAAGGVISAGYQNSNVLLHRRHGVLRALGSHIIVCRTLTLAQRQGPRSSAVARARVGRAWDNSIARSKVPFGSPISKNGHRF